MDKAVLQHLISAIKETPLHTDPYPYFYVEDVFPADFYYELLAKLPDLSFYRGISETGKVSKGSYQQRFILSLKSPAVEQLSLAQAVFWKNFSQMLDSELWTSLLIEKFGAHIKERFGYLSEMIQFSTVQELIKDQTKFSVGPHSDLPHRLCTLLFYFPNSNDQKHLGTSIYRPRDPTFQSDGHKHYPFEDFIKVDTVPFVPNSLFGFLRTDQSFHGVEPIREEKVERNLMNYFLKWSPK